MAKGTVVVLGSGPIRIGQGIEFDYSCVHCVWALREAGYRAVIVNNNPETVSTDFDTADALYFEPVTLADVRRVVEHEKADGVIVQFGGQTAINLAGHLEEAGIPVIGTAPKSIAAAEDRSQFDTLLSGLGVSRPPGRAVRSLADARVVAEEIGYPVLVRPSFVLGGRAMDIVYDADYLDAFYSHAEEANPGQPVLVDKYFLGVEAELDVVSDGIDTFIPGVMEHIDRAGVHSGDSMTVIPPVGLSAEVVGQMVEVSSRIARALEVRGLMNAQFVVSGGVAHVIEVNPRASRTVPYVSKVTGIPMVSLATRVTMGESLASMGYRSGLWSPAPEGERPEGSRVAGRFITDFNQPLPEPRLYAVKAPVFSFQKLARVDPALGPEMKSTGEVLGIDRTYEAALYKALVASGVQFRPHGQVILTVAGEDKEAAVTIAQKLAARGYNIAATPGTHAAIVQSGTACERINKIQEGEPNILDRVLGGEVSLMVNTPGPAQTATEQASRIRRACIETGVACVTSIDTALALADSLAVFEDPERADCRTVGEYLTG
ncbi:MAG: carbamoyl-phosphate synthase large subunit [Fimbriimonadaceae bacterium]|nr:carbamoyl-phosphate synthase large subunit [Fimbriimonadaceae bacterium]QYK55134.1 MAG: carbamoyl-phosphate synthase large subunit [Fimbriimonadaceae bacterium]